MAIADREQLARYFSKFAHCAACGDACTLVYDPTNTFFDTETGVAVAPFYAQCPNAEHRITRLATAPFADDDTPMEVVEEESPTGIRKVIKRFFDGPTGMSPFAD